MKRSKKTVPQVSALKPALNLRAGALIAVLLLIGAVSAIAKYKSHSKDPQPRPVASQPGSRFVTVNVGGKKLQVNAQTMQQGPLSQDQAQQIAAALQDNQSADGLVQEQNPDGSVSVDLQGRFQNVILAKQNADGSLDQTCVDNAAAASAFLRTKETTTQSETGQGRRAVVKE
ncbi:MAG: hypothetical protein QOK48_2127 [Blastocatellia bacterium]|jgi:hypothetical protein|nr:hypothetical protein [Blastocatellia bacterium]